MEEFSIVECTDKSITLSFKGTDTTLINPIMDVLDRDRNVKLARYVTIHPELEEPQLIVEMKDESTITAKQALINAANYVSSYFSTINTCSSTVSDKSNNNEKRNKMNTEDCAAADGERERMNTEDCAAADGDELVSDNN